MMIKYSIRQLVRMKGRAGLFLLLLILACGLLSVGRGFQVINSRNMQAYEDGFMTIGIVEQKADMVQEVQNWDAGIRDYHIYNRSVFNAYVQLPVLEFEGADYLSGPEKRVYYGAYNPEYTMYDGLDDRIVVEVTTSVDVLPDHPVELMITRVFVGSGLWEGLKIYFCNHYDPEPEMLYAGKTYVMSLQSRPGHKNTNMSYEYAPWPVLKSEQVKPDGTPVRDELEADYFYDEVTDGFYETERGRRWMEVLKTWDYMEHIFPVTGTDNIYLMMAFYNGDAWISSGREFTEEEYAAGEKVCLIPDNFAAKNGLQVGDEIRLPLLYASHNHSAGRMFGNNGSKSIVLLNAEGKIYSVFEDSMYTVTGLYKGSAGLMDEYGLAYNEIIIPARSVKNSDEDNIVDYGPMRGSTTSFQIENGTIQEYLEKWNRQGIGNVEITFYDGGYTQMEAGIENMTHISRLLIFMGMVMVLMVLLYFVWLFIVRQREGTAIERCLGLRKRQCFWSLFTGLFLLTAVGSICGCTAGSLLSEQIAKTIEPADYYDDSFSNGMVSGEAPAEEAETALPVWEMIRMISGILVVGSGIAGMGIWLNLRQEPMKMLTKREE